MRAGRPRVPPLPGQIIPPAASHRVKRIRQTLSQYVRLPEASSGCGMPQARHWSCRARSKTQALVGVRTSLSRHHQTRAGQRALVQPSAALVVTPECEGREHAQPRASVAPAMPRLVELAVAQTAKSNVVVGSGRLGRVGILAVLVGLGLFVAMKVRPVLGLPNARQAGVLGRGAVVALQGAVAPVVRRSRGVRVTYCVTTVPGALSGDVAGPQSVPVLSAVAVADAVPEGRSSFAVDVLHHEEGHPVADPTALTLRAPFRLAHALPVTGCAMLRLAGPAPDRVPVTSGLVFVEVAEGLRLAALGAGLGFDVDYCDGKAIHSLK